MAKEDENKEQQEEVLENNISAAHFFHFPSAPLRPLSAAAFWERCHPVQNFPPGGNSFGWIREVLLGKAHLFD